MGEADQPDRVHDKDNRTPEEQELHQLRKENQQLHGTLGYLSPVEFSKTYTL